MDLDSLDFSPEAVWREAPFDRNAVGRVLDAAGLQISAPEGDKEALRLTLAHLSWWCFQMARPPQLSRKESEAIGDAFFKLAKAMLAVRWAPNAPPRMPQDWALEMINWTRKLLEPAPKGAAVQSFYQFAIPKLLAFYGLAFAEKPAATANGPTERFISAFLDELISVLQAARWTSEPGDMPTLSKLVTKPTPDALRQKIRRLRNGTEDDQFVGYLFSKFAGGTEFVGNTDGAPLPH